MNPGVPPEWFWNMFQPASDGQNAIPYVCNAVLQEAALLQVIIHGLKIIEACKLSGALVSRNGAMIVNGSQVGPRSHFLGGDDSPVILTTLASTVRPHSYPSPRHCIAAEVEVTLVVDQLHIWGISKGHYWNKALKLTFSSARSQRQCQATPRH